MNDVVSVAVTVSVNRSVMELVAVAVKVSDVMSVAVTVSVKRSV